MVHVRPLLFGLLVLTGLGGCVRTSPSFSYLYGWRDVDESLGPAAGSQRVMGFQYQDQPRAWPVAFELGARTSASERIVQAGTATTKHELSVAEWFVGARQAWGLADGSLRPYAAVDLVYVRPTYDLYAPGADSRDVDASFGASVHAGVLWHLAEHWHLGADVRQTFASAELFGANGDLNDLQITLQAGLRLD